MPGCACVVVGSGGRGAARLALVLADHDVVVTPGNAGIPGSVATPAEELEADLFVIGPEQPLVDGLADRLRAQGKVVFGPGADGAQVEGSKAYMKELVAAAGVPTARHGTSTDPDEAIAFLRSLPPPYVVKTDGLAAGKGVLVTARPGRGRGRRASQAGRRDVRNAGRTVVIEEGMTGPEVSVFAICDGTRAIALAPAQDFKRVGDDDTGPNTGGMGAYCPLPWLGPVASSTMWSKRFVQPTLDELRRRGHRLPRGPLHGPHDHRRGPEARRVQRALRRSRRPGRAAAAHHRPRRAAATRRRPVGCAPSPPTTTARAVLVRRRGGGLSRRRSQSGDEISGLDGPRARAG